MTIQDFGNFSFPGGQREVFAEKRAPDPGFFSSKEEPGGQNHGMAGPQPQSKFPLMANDPIGVFHFIKVGREQIEVRRHWGKQGATAPSRQTQNGDKRRVK